MLPRVLVSRLETDYQVKIKTEKVLGGGSNGYVYRLQTKSDEYFCLKSIYLTNPSAENDFKITQTMYQTDSFKVNAYSDQTSLYFVMPYFVGEDLSKLLAMDLPLSVDLRKKIFLQIVKMVNEMHHKGIIHRDLKPDNIIVYLKGDENPEIHIIDFGRAVRVFDSQTGKTLANPETLSLVKTTNSWTSYFFYPAYQFFRKWQPQTAPELTTLSSHRFGYSYEAGNVGFRSDYYAMANLFKQLVPEMGAMADAIISCQAPHERNDLYFELITALDSTMKVTDGRSLADQYTREREEKEAVQQAAITAAAAAITVNDHSTLSSAVCAPHP